MIKLYIFALCCFQARSFYSLYIFVTLNCINKAHISELRVNLNKKVVLSQGDRASPRYVLFGLKFADNIHYQFKSSQASKAMLQSSKHTGAK